VSDSLIHTFGRTVVFPSGTANSATFFLTITNLSSKLIKMYTLIIIKYNFFYNSFVKILDFHHHTSKSIIEIGETHGFKEDNSLRFPNDREGLVINSCTDGSEVVVFIIKYRGK
jgi:hypothetical protein